MRKKKGVIARMHLVARELARDNDVASKADFASELAIYGMSHVSKPDVASELASYGKKI